MPYLRIVTLLFAGLLTVGPLGAQSYTVVAEDYPPYQYVEGGEPKGLDFEMLELAAQRAGLSLEYRFVPWVRAESMVKTGTADAIFSLYRNPEREAYLWFPSLRLSPVKPVLLATARYQGRPGKLANLEGMSVGVASGNYYGPVFENYQGLKKVPNPDAASVLRHLVEGHYDLAVANLFLAKHLIAKNGWKGLRILDLDLGTSAYYVGFSKASPRGQELFARLVPALEALEASGELDRLRQRYSNAP